MSLQFSEKVFAKSKQIAEECQGHNHAYCTARCPMRTDAMGYVNLIRENKLEEAVLRIREKLFLPASLGRICAHPCEAECRRNKEYNEPLAIAGLKRYAADTSDKESLWDFSKKPASVKTIAVIGAGPAGAQAAIDLAREGHEVIIYDSLPVYGGMMRVGIPAYRLPRDIIDFEYSYLEKLGISFKMGVHVGKDITFEQIRSTHDAVIVAIGAHISAKIPTKGDDCANITNAVDFLLAASLSDKLDVPCKTVIVIGGGDVAMDCARSAVRLGASSVTLVSLEKRDALPASKHEQKGALDEGIVFHCGYGALEFLSGEASSQELPHSEEAVTPNTGSTVGISGAVFRECLAVFDAEGRFNPTYSDKTMTLDCDTLIFAAGQLVQDATGGALEQARAGRYVTDTQTLATSIEGVFVAGDCAGATIVVEAMALGRKAALSAIRYLDGRSLEADRDFSMEFSCISKLSIPLPENVENTPRKHTREMDVAQRIQSFVECDFGFDSETALAEASRCLQCECKKCMEECIMLNDYTAYPGELFAKFLATGDMEPVIAYSCNMCDQCTLVCPEDYKFAELFGAIRKDMVIANGGNSPMKGHKAINMHQFLGFSK